MGVLPSKLLVNLSQSSLRVDTSSGSIDSCPLIRRFTTRITDLTGQHWAHCSRFCDKWSFLSCRNEIYNAVFMEN